MKKITLIILSILIIFLMTGCEFIEITTPNTSTEPIEYTYFLNPGVDTIIRGDVWEDAGLVVRINGEETIVYTDNEIDYLSDESQKINYSITFENITVEAYRYVSVIDREDISITINPGVDTIYVGETWVDAGAIIETDHTIIVEESVNNQLPGNYEVTYYVEDQYGVITKTTRMVKVLEPN